MTRHTISAALLAASLTAAGCGGGGSDDEADAGDRDAMVGALVSLEVVGSDDPEAMRCVADQLLDDGITVEDMTAEEPDDDVVESYRDARDGCGLSAEDRLDEVLEDLEG